MNKTRIVLADLNEEYLIPIELKLIHELGNDIDLEVISTSDYFSLFFSEAKAIDILLIDAELFSENILKHNIKNIFVLAEELKDTTKEANVYCIYKYSSVKEIYNEITYRCVNNLKGYRSRDKKSKIIVIYSPSGGTGKTSLALGLSAVLSDNYYKTLYVDAERIQTFHSRLKSKEETPSSIGYEIQESKDDLYSGLKHYIRKEQFEYLLPFCATISALDIEFSFFLKFVDAVKASNEYDYVVVDTDKTLDNDKFALMKMADKIFLVHRPLKTDIFDMHLFINNVNITDSEKFIFVCNQYDPNHTDWIREGLKYSVSGFLECTDSEELLSIDGLKDLEGIRSLIYLL